MSTVVAGGVAEVEVVDGHVGRLLDGIEWLEGDNARLRAEVAGLEVERDLFAAQVRVDRATIAGLEAANAALKRQVARLEGRLEATRREGKRQSAPFSKGPPKPAGKRRPPGRKAGEDYGTKAWRKVPDRVDEVKQAPPPERCGRDGCGGRVEPTGVTRSQWVSDLPPVEPYVTRYDMGEGVCVDCGRVVWGRHAEQTSEAVGAAASQVGPRAVALAARLHHGYGLSHAKACQVLADFAGIGLTPGGLVAALHRTADRLVPTDAALVETVRGSEMVSPDETGWRVAGQHRWLWAFATPTVVVYRILDGRGFDEAASVLGDGYAGVLVRDGWAPYRKFELAAHQTCLAHIGRRCHELVGDSRAGQARVPHLVAQIIGDALELRDRRDAGDLAPGELAEQVTALRQRVEKLTAWRPTHQPNRRLLGHLAREADALFTFLCHPGIDATNWRAEQAIRPAVVNRKAWGGNTSDRGALTGQIIAGVLATCRLQQRDPVTVIIPVLRARGPTPADLDYTPTPLPATTAPATAS